MPLQSPARPSTSVSLQLHRSCTAAAVFALKVFVPLQLQLCLYHNLSGCICCAAAAASASVALLLWRAAAAADSQEEV